MQEKADGAAAVGVAEEAAVDSAEEEASQVVEDLLAEAEQAEAGNLYIHKLVN